MDELKDMYDAEHRIIRALPKLAKAATCEKLEAAFLKHLEETRKAKSLNLRRFFKPLENRPRQKSAKPRLDCLKKAMRLLPKTKMSQQSMPR